MFARWRNLAAAAGAICFPVSFLHASLQIDDSRCIRSVPSARQQFTTEESWFRSERDSWYERYYGSNFDEQTLNNSGNALLPILPLQTVDQPSVIILDIDPIDESSDDFMAEENGCIEPTLSDDAENLSDDDMNDVVTPSGTQDTSPSAPNSAIESEFFNVYAPYLGGDEIEVPPSESKPTAYLTGSIEPIFEDCEDTWFDEWLRGERRYQGSGTILNDIEPIEPSHNYYDEGFDADDTYVNPDDSNDGGRDYHMFYPGCDWNPYYPASQKGEQTKPMLPEDLRSA